VRLEIAACTFIPFPNTASSCLVLPKSAYIFCILPHFFDQKGSVAYRCLSFVYPLFIHSVCGVYPLLIHERSGDGFWQFLERVQF